MSATGLATAAFERLDSVWENESDGEIVRGDVEEDRGILFLLGEEGGSGCLEHEVRGMTKAGGRVKRHEGESVFNDGEACGDDGGSISMFEVPRGSVLLSLSLCRLLTVKSSVEVADSVVPGCSQ